MDSISGFSQRVNELLDNYNFPKDRKRSGALAKLLNTTTFTSRRIINDDIPPKDSTLIELIKSLDKNLNIKSTFVYLKYGITDTPPKLDKDLFLMGHIARSVYLKSQELGIDTDSIPDNILENLWRKIFKHSKSKEGEIDLEYTTDLLLKLRELLS
ncbi:hypothetical protein [Pleionea litopenaei]|uniref:Uncharacterized protein n=1 Tax=Pleionea litopenaei TaxID=3070815 RepID=A0AA51X9L8_9GAMM|nr:hypothetical protein [Pleionea sp. HL-JVS1]WMS89284.1 hypothetical protein Q9312_19305 [Pleionea sp. HL-JVS1]WMS89305.1 hypothetical protein Q9312_19195 [Pleionea sp. HL-JVS1]